MQAQRIKSFKSIGIKKTLDFEVNHPDHNFYANNTVVSNSHAVSYAKLSAASVYLKFEKSLDFFTEALKLCKEKQDPTGEIATLVREMPHFGIKLLPPDLLLSDIEFKKEGENIRYGLSSIKSVAEKSISKIKQFIDKEKTNLFDVFQAAKQAKLNTTVFVALIETGCLDSFNPNRQFTTLCWRIFNQLTAKEVQFCLSNGEKYEFDLIKALRDFENWADGNGKKIGKESRLQTLRTKSEPYFQIYKENNKHPNLSEFLHERALLGFSSHKLRELFVEYPHLHSIHQIKTELYEKDKVRLVAEVLEVHIAVSKKSSKKYCRLLVGDDTGVFSVGFFGDKWENYKRMNTDPEEGQILYIEAERANDILWGNSMTQLRLDVFMRVRDLRKLEKKEAQEPEVS